MVRLVASDLDGTLLKDGSQELNPELFDMIMKLKEQFIKTKESKMPCEHL